MDRPRCRRRSSATRLAQTIAVEAPRPPSRGSPFLKSVALLGVSAVCASLPSRAEAFVTSSVRGLQTHHLRAGQRSEGLERGRISVAMMSERRGLWPSRPPIDLRSDTVTQPTGGMRKAMQKVRAGLFAWGLHWARGYDPHQRAIWVELCMCWWCRSRRVPSPLLRYIYMAL